MRRLSFAAIALVLAALPSAAIVRGDVTVVQKGGVLFVEEFDTVVTDADRGKGWAVGDPPAVEMTAVDGEAVLRKIGPSTFAKVQRYVPFDLTEKAGYPYLHVALGTGDGHLCVANQSTGGQYFTYRLTGPGLFTVDLRQTSRLVQLTKGRFALTFYVFGPRGDKPGPESRIDSIKAVSSSADHIVTELVDKQVDDQPGRGYASVGDLIKVTLTTSKPAKGVTFSFVEGRHGKAVKLSGKTAFKAAGATGGTVWTVEIPMTAESDRAFKTTTTTDDGTVVDRVGMVNVVAEIDEGPWPKIVSYVPFGFDLTIR